MNCERFFFVAFCLWLFVVEMVCGEVISMVILTRILFRTLFYPIEIAEIVFTLFTVSTYEVYGEGGFGVGFGF